MSYLGNEPLLGYNTRDLFAGTGAQTAFTLSRSASGVNGIIVAVSGVVQDPTMYSVVGKTLTFNEAPPSPTPGSVTNIDVTYLNKLATPYSTTWTIPIATNSGSTTAIIANPATPVASLTDNLVVKVVMPSANTTTTPTVNVSGLGVGNIVNADGSAVFIGQLSGTIELRYDLGATNWKLVSVQSTSVSTSRIFSITASVASNAMTCTLNPTTLDFRSATLSSGTVNTRGVSSAISLVIPSTATLGTINAVQNRLVLLALDNAGTVELAISNISGGVNLDETTLISTAAIAGASNSANTVYSTTSRSNVPFRVLGYIESTQATAGTWATAPSTIQGAGGLATAFTTGLGYGQTWQAVTRTAGTTYYNTTGKTIKIKLLITANSGYTSITVNGLQVAYGGGAGVSVFYDCSAEIPPGASYVMNNTVSNTFTAIELR